ncbi:MAG: GntR family transcriptional regulator, partial [Mesorhizobium sp.]
LGKVDAACRKHLKSARQTLLTSIPEGRQPQHA